MPCFLLAANREMRTFIPENENTMIRQQIIVLPAMRRGYHLITAHVLRQLGDLPQEGLLHLFIQHTSAALTVNENADPSVRADFEPAINHIVPEGARYYTHTLEGDDDMPAHIKSSLLGASVTIPVRGGRLALGTWQGIYLCEFRDCGGERRIVATLLS